MNISGSNIRKFRKEQKLTQAEFVARCQVSDFDITRSTLAKIESNCRQVTDIELKKIAAVLNVSEADLK